jgi:hypothetical protein
MILATCCAILLRLSWAYPCHGWVFRREVVEEQGMELCVEEERRLSDRSWYLYLLRMVVAHGIAASQQHIVESAVTFILLELSERVETIDNDVHSTMFFTIHSLRHFSRL